MFNNNIFQKKLFTRTNQPMALEVLGYILCILAFLLAVTSTLGSWRSYLYGLIAASVVGVAYRLIVVYNEKIQHRLCRLAGKLPNELSEQEQLRYAVIGASLFIPPIMAGFTFPYLLQVSFDAPLAVSYLLAIPMMAVIFIIDRSFVVTMGWRKSWYAIAIRIVLATTLGIFLSKPIELQLFHQETTEELKVQKAEKLAAIEQERSEQKAAIDQREEEAKSEVTAAFENFRNEVDKGNGVRVAKYGPEARRKEKIYQRLDSLYRVETAPLIAADRARVDSMANSQRVEYSQSQSYGFGARSAALDAAGQKYPAVRFTSWLIMITLIMLDISPLLAKLLMPASASDREERKDDEEAEHALNMSRIEKRYALMKKELREALKTIDLLDLPDDRKDDLRQVIRDKVSRRYFGEDIFSQN